MYENVTKKTGILYVGSEPKMPVERPETPPIYVSTANIICDMDDYDNASQGNKYYYCRTANPNRDNVADAVSFLEQGEQSLVCASGMAAISTTLLSLAKAGDHIITSNAIYGETIELFDRIITKFGMEVTYVDLTNREEVQRAVRDNTKIIYTEIITNPLIRVVDIDSIVDIAHRVGALVVVDSTFTTPFALRPLEHGADIVIHSMTKYFGGHSDLTAGCITGRCELMKKIYSDYLLFGTCLDPNSSWLMLRSIRTMEMRVTRQFANAKALAEALQKDDHVQYVNYPSLTNHPQHELASRQMENGMYGGMISFELKDDVKGLSSFEAGKKLLNSLKIPAIAVSLGDPDSLIEHPASMTHANVSPEDRLAAGITDGLIRLSVGLESAKDLIADFEQAFAAI